MNYSLTNPKIQAYLNGDNSNPPVSELIYLHSHPLIRPNFINEIEELILQAGSHIQSKGINGYPVDSLRSIAINIGTKMPTFNEESAPLILEELRKLYVVCNQIIGMQ